MKEEDLGDTVLVHGKDGDGNWLCTRNRDGVKSAGMFLPVVYGRPLVGEFVELTPREEDPDLYDVDVIYAAPSHGPPKVTTDGYRRGWDAVFAAKGLPN